jgi:hypothetical protein
LPHASEMVVIGFVGGSQNAEQHLVRTRWSPRRSVAHRGDRRARAHDSIPHAARRDERSVHHARDDSCGSLGAASQPRGSGDVRDDFGFCRGPGISRVGRGAHVGATGTRRHLSRARACEARLAQPGFGAGGDAPDQHVEDRAVLQGARDAGARGRPASTALVTGRPAPSAGVRAIRILERDAGGERAHRHRRTARVNAGTSPIGVAAVPP